MTARETRTQSHSAERRHLLRSSQNTSPMGEHLACQASLLWTNRFKEQLPEFCKVISAILMRCQEARL